jgi:hypothetical protein
MKSTQGGGDQGLATSKGIQKRHKHSHQGFKGLSLTIALYMRNTASTYKSRGCFVSGNGRGGLQTRVWRGNLSFLQNVRAALKSWPLPQPFAFNITCYFAL